MKERIRICIVTDRESCIIGIEGPYSTSKWSEFRKNNKQIAENLEIQTKYLTDENIKSLFVFGKDERVDLDTIKINDMFKPALIEYYNNEVENW